MSGLHRLERADPGTMVVMITDRDRHWQSACYRESVNVTGFDPDAPSQAALVDYCLDPWQVDTMVRYYGKIALDSKPAEVPPDTLYDEVGRLKPEHRGKRMRPSKKSRAAARRRVVELHEPPVIVVTQPEGVTEDNFVDEFRKVAQHGWVTPLPEGDWDFRFGPEYDATRDPANDFMLRPARAEVLPPTGEYKAVPLPPFPNRPPFQGRVPASTVRLFDNTDMSGLDLPTEIFGSDPDGMTRQ